MPNSQQSAAKRYSSRFIVDVVVEPDSIALIDQSHVKHVIKLSNEKGVQSFKAWMQNVFLKGAAGTLTVFSWHREESDGEALSVIDQVFTTGKPTPIS